MKRSEVLLGLYIAVGSFVLLCAMQILLPAEATVMLAAVSAACGGFVHASGSFVKHTGVGDMDQKWTWWYVIHPIRAAILGVAMVGAMLAGVIAVGSSEPPNPQLLTTLGFLTGLFSDRAIAKLADVANTMFSTHEKDPPATNS